MTMDPLEPCGPFNSPPMLQTRGRRFEGPHPFCREEFQAAKVDHADANLYKAEKDDNEKKD